MERDQWGAWELGCLGEGKKGPIWRFDRVPFYLDRIFHFSLFEIALYWHLSRRKSHKVRAVRFHGREQAMRPSSVMVKLDQLARELTDQGLRTNAKSLRATLRRWQTMGLVQVVASRMNGSGGTVVTFQSEDKIPALKSLRLQFQPIKSDSASPGDQMELAGDENTQCRVLPIKMPNKPDEQVPELIGEKIVATQNTAEQTAEPKYLRLKSVFLKGILAQIESGIGLHNISYDALHGADIPRHIFSDGTADEFRNEIHSIVGDYIGDVRIDDDEGGLEAQKEFRKKGRYLQVIGKAWEKVLTTHSHDDKLAEIRRTGLLYQHYSFRQVAQAVDWVLRHGDLEKGTPVEFPIQYLLDHVDGVLKRVEIEDRKRERLTVLLQIELLKQQLAVLENRLQGDRAETRSADAVQIAPGRPPTRQTTDGKGLPAWKTKKATAGKRARPMTKDEMEAEAQRQIAALAAVEAARGDPDPD